MYHTDTKCKILLQLLHDRFREGRYLFYLLEQCWQYGLAEDTLRTGGLANAKEISPNELYSQSAIYIAAAHALKPSYSVFTFLICL